MAKTIRSWPVAQVHASADGAIPQRRTSPARLACFIVRLHGLAAGRVSYGRCAPQFSPSLLGLSNSPRRTEPSFDSGLQAYRSETLLCRSQALHLGRSVDLQVKFDYAGAVSQ